MFGIFCMRLQSFYTLPKTYIVFEQTRHLAQRTFPLIFHCLPVNLFEKKSYI